MNFELFNIFLYESNLLLMTGDVSEKGFDFVFKKIFYVFNLLLLFGIDCFSLFLVLFCVFYNEFLHLVAARNENTHLASCYLFNLFPKHFWLNKLYINFLIQQRRLNIFHYNFYCIFSKRIWYIVQDGVLGFGVWGLGFGVWA